MSGKNTYWISDPEGSYALVEGADQRDLWTKVHGWSEADEPGPQDFVWVRHEDPALGASRLTRAAAELPAWAGRGWAPGAPLEPVNAALAHWPGSEPAAAELAPKAEPAHKSSSAKASATSGEKKE